MRYWWVNQNQTYRHELAGGYLWSPKRNANGARNPFYESMREVAPGHLVRCWRAEPCSSGGTRATSSPPSLATTRPGTVSQDPSRPASSSAVARPIPLEPPVI